jgi:hypothetical protein
MVGYAHPCRYCNLIIPPDSNVCPGCGKKNPLGSLRCSKCKSPIQKGWHRCNTCGLDLLIICPKCKTLTFFGDYCDACGEEITIACSKCKTVQPPIGVTCIKCGKSLELPK